jgi:hypothetical protein
MDNVHSLGFPKRIEKKSTARFVIGSRQSSVFIEVFIQFYIEYVILNDKIFAKLSVKR